MGKVIKDDKIYSKSFLQVKHICQWVVKPKTIKYYKRLPCYLSFLSYVSGLFFIAIANLFVAIFLKIKKLKSINIFLETIYYLSALI